MKWRKSSRSQANGTNSDCVEARTIAGAFQVRDSKLGESSPVFGLAEGEFAGLLRAAKRLGSI
ncbi:DUF397 domain-containing protein [Natronoglycomyces albus]|uniref:DUF397 domain-containing protein n=1 Tax=Natronoglycomyces albus TaxID=2811108 RepID=A0A895XU36_9ACTN|nr:DUF397 domain-containing protein [Natronoglycomyces albus]QSB05760.1 DUF397 domain-containing protein [Natronoglycomyces albus]